MSLKVETISALMWKLFERGGRAIVELIVQIVMARLLAPDDFGALAIMLVFVNLGNVIVQSGLNTALIQAPDATDEDFSTVFWMSLFLSVVLYVIVFSLSPAVGAFYDASNLIWPLRGLAIILIVNSLNSVQIAWVTRRLQMKKIFFSTIASVLVSATAGICAAKSGAGLWALVIQQVAYHTVGCVALFSQIEWRPRFVFNPDKARGLFAFGWRLLVSGALDQIYQSLTDLVVGKRFSPFQLGLVSQGKKYPLAVGSMLDGAIQPVMLSAVSHVQDDRARVKRLVRRALKTSTYLIVPMMTLFACCAPTLIPLMLGNQWQDSVWFLQVYCLVYALLPIHTTNLQALNGVGRSDLFLKLEVIKKAYGLAMLLFCAFVLNDVHMMVASNLLTGVLSTFVNAWPNKEVIGYAYGEQIRDIAPSFILSTIAAIGAVGVGIVGFGGIEAIVLQAFIFMTTYLGLSALVHLETYEYLRRTVRDMFASKSF